MKLAPNFSSGSMPEWVNWIAQDANGNWWGYEVEPLLHDNGWYENELGRYTLIKTSPPNQSWRNNLIKLVNTVSCS